MWAVKNTLNLFDGRGEKWIFFILSSWRRSIIALKVLCKTSFENDNISSVTKTFWCCSFALRGRETSHKAAHLPANCCCACSFFFIHSPRTLNWTFQSIQARFSGLQKLLIALLVIFCNILKCLFSMSVECYYFSSWWNYSVQHRPKVVDRSKDSNILSLSAVTAVVFIPPRIWQLSPWCSINYTKKRHPEQLLVKTSPLLMATLGWIEGNPWAVMRPGLKTSRRRRLFKKESLKWT